MHERGTYGKQARQAWNAGPSVVGVDTKRVAVDLGFNVFSALLMTAAGFWIGGQATPKEPTKGRIIGGAVGYFANLMLAQKFALERIADHISTPSLKG
jgi:hypothetical protein